MAQAASPLQTVQMEVGTTLDPHFLHLHVRYWAFHNPCSLLIVWHPCLIITEAIESGGRGAVLGQGDSSTFSEWFFKSFSLHIPVHPPPSPPQHLPWDQARDRWQLGDRGAVRHKQSGYQILSSTPAAQLDLRIHSHLTATPATDPMTYHTSKCAHTETTHIRTHMHKLLPFTNYCTQTLQPWHCISLNIKLLWWRLAQQTRQILLKSHTKPCYILW